MSNFADAKLKIGDRVQVDDDVDGLVWGEIVRFNNEGYPVARFMDSTVVVFPDMITRVVES